MKFPLFAQGQEDILGDLLRSEAVLFQQFFDHIAVLELFALASDEDFHIAVAVESGDFLAPATVNLTVLKSDYEFVIGLECLKGLRVEGCDDSRVDQRRVNALGFQKLTGLLSELVVSPKTKNGHPTASVGDFALGRRPVNTFSLDLRT